MLKSFINKKNVTRYHYLVQKINAHYHTLCKQKDLDLKSKLNELKEATDITEKEKTIQAMAIAKIASEWVLGMTYYDVQLMGALALVDGLMTEMKTGEGKTLTCSASVIANYVLGYKTHVATANDYLAERDETTLKELYAFLGITSSFNVSSLTKAQKKNAYLSDVVYSTAQELGFDFLKDNLVYSLEEKMQPLFFDKIKCIIDEADFVLIDEARTPLIISGESPLKGREVYDLIRDLIKNFEVITIDPNNISIFEEVIEDGEIWLDKKQYNAFFGERGYSKLEQLCFENGLLQKPDDIKANKNLLYRDENSWIIHEAINAVKAKYLYIKDKDYVIQDNQIVIVDPNTGRLSNGRTWSNGLHQAIESKEYLEIHPESVTMGSISIQNYFRNYQQISGMSGTIMQSSEEFEEIYGCKTISIPTNKPIIRQDYQDRIYLNKNSKYHYLVEEVLTRHKKGQPVLIGTVSVAESEIISNLLEEKQAYHYVLNAKNNALEAQIIAQAGEPGRITVATSMAGRGTDIILGGNKTQILTLLKEQLEQTKERIDYANMVTEQLNISLNIHIDLNTIKNHIYVDIARNHTDLMELYDNDLFTQYIVVQPEFIWNKLYQLKYSLEQQIILVEENAENWKKQVIEAGGLCVIGSSRNESRRIDDQLKGRSGRQGDVGESVFYLSLEDPWVQIFGQNKMIAYLMKTLPNNQLISAPSVTKIFTKAQQNIEANNFNIRKITYQYDSLVDEGRRNFLNIRNTLLLSNSEIKTWIQSKLMDDFRILATEDFLEYLEDVKSPVPLEFKDLLNMSLKDIYHYIHAYFKDEKTFFINDKPIKSYLVFLEEKIKSILLEKDDNYWHHFCLSSLKELDNLWAQHLSDIDEAQRNVNFSSLVQKNPVYEYKIICFQSFAGMIEKFKNKLITNLIEGEEVNDYNS